MVDDSLLLVLEEKILTFLKKQGVERYLLTADEIYSPKKTKENARKLILNPRSSLLMRRRGMT